MKLDTLPSRSKPAQLGKSGPRRSLTNPGGWTILFLVSLVGGAILYLGEGWLAYTGAFPLPVLVSVGIGYVVWLYVVETSWRKRGGGP